MKLEPSGRLSQRYTELLEESNRRLDGKLLEVALFNEMAIGFSSAAFDQWNIAGFLFKILKKKFSVLAVAVFLPEDSRPSLVLASEGHPPTAFQEKLRSQIAEEWAKNNPKSCEPQGISVVEILEGEGRTQDFSAPILRVQPLVVLDKPIGLMGMAFLEAPSMTQEDEKFFTTLAVQIALFIENDRIKQTLVHQAEELACSNKELEAFSYSVSHDLRGPLTRIDGFSQILLEDYGDKLDAQGKEHLQRVRVATQRMGELIDDLLSLAQVTRSEIHKGTVDLSALAGTVASELKKNQPERPVEFVIAPGLTAQADPKLLRIVLENLLGNSWKYTGKHPKARIEVGMIQKEGKPAYFVRDDGAGFDMAYAGKLFSAFQRLHTPSEFPGTGIGLATVARIIHRHGGRVWAEGQVEKGATLYFTLE